MKSETLRGVPAHKVAEVVRGLIADGAHRIELARARRGTWAITAYFATRSSTT